MSVQSIIEKLKENLSYIDKTDDKHYIDKIVELYEEGVDEQTLQSIFWQRFEIEDWLTDKSLDGKDYITLYKENEKGIFRITTYKTDKVKQVWLSTLVAEDEDVTINMPKTFEEAHLLGVDGWCFCDNETYWLQHTNPTNKEGYGETIYFIHNVLQEHPDDYATDMVKEDGSHEVLNKEHHQLNISHYLRSVGNIANRLVPSHNIIKESKTTKNMKKNTIKLTESQLKKVIAESVKRVLSETIETGPYNQPIYEPTSNGHENLYGYPEYDKMPKELGKHNVIKHQWKDNGYYDTDSPIITLDDVPFEYLKDMVERFNSRKPIKDGFHGADDAWLSYWQKTLNDYYKSRNNA